MDLRDLRGRTHRLVIALVAAGLAYEGATRIAVHLRAGHGWTGARDLFIFSTGVFVGVLVLVSTLAVLNHRAKRKSDFPRATARIQS